MTALRKQQDVVSTSPERERMLAQIKEDGPSALGVFRRAYTGKSLRAAIDAACLECVWLDRETIRTCPSKACPIWSVRPFQQKRPALGGS